MRAGGCSIMEFTWHGLNPLVCLNLSWTAVHYISLLCDYCTNSWTPCTITTKVYSSSIISCHWVEVVHNYFEQHYVDFRWMLWPQHSLDRSQLSMYRSWGRDLFAHFTNPSLTNISELWTAIEMTWFNISL